MPARLAPLTVLVLLAAPAPARAYIAVDAGRLTLCEVMLEFPTALALTVEKLDADRAAYIFDTTATLQGKAPAASVKIVLDADAAKRLKGLKKGSPAVVFLGSVDNRSLVFAEGAWFITRPDQGWEKFDQFRDDFAALFAGSPAELAAAVRALARGGAVTVAVAPKGLEPNTRAFVRYDAEFPHRRFPAPDPKAPKMTGDEAKTALGSKSAAARQQAVLAVALAADAEPALVKALGDGHSEVRIAAAWALGERKAASKAAVEALARALEDDDRFVCAFAGWALGRAGAGAKPAVPALLKALGDRNFDHDFRPHRAAEAAETLLRLAPNDDATARAVAFFLTDRMLNDHQIDSEGTRTAAARALGRSGPAAKAALPELAKRLKDEVAATRVAAAESLILIGGDTRRAAAEKVLAAELASGDVGTRVQAARAIAATKATALRPQLQKAADDKDEYVKRAAQDATQSLAK